MQHFGKAQPLTYIYSGTAKGIAKGIAKAVLENGPIKSLETDARGDYVDLFHPARLQETT
jgi:hypothetical protein